MAASAMIRVLRRNLQQALRHRQVAQAEDLLQRLKQEDALSLETRGLELELLVAGRRWDEAERLAEHLLRLFPSSARIHYLSGRIQSQRKRYGRALEHFTEADRLHPHWTVRRWIGTTHTQRGEYTAAEALLVGLAAEHAEVQRDLAWLYERRGDPQRALHALEAYLALRPDDRAAQRQRLRLRASAAPAEALVGEVAALEELGEEIAPEILPAYVQRLLESAAGAAARCYIEQHAPGWTPELAGRVAWVCHRLQAYDLAWRLFLDGLPVAHRDFKYCSALEAAALRCGRAGDVANAYHALAAQHPHLHGRLKALRRRIK
jgi:tetratricopeptide (TPR) repeat protein